MFYSATGDFFIKKLEEHLDDSYNTMNGVILSSNNFYLTVIKNNDNNLNLVRVNSIKKATIFKPELENGMYFLSFEDRNNIKNYIDNSGNIVSVKKSILNLSSIQLDTTFNLGVFGTIIIKKPSDETETPEYLLDEYIFNMDLKVDKLEEKIINMDFTIDEIKQEPIDMNLKINEIKNDLPNMNLQINETSNNEIKEKSKTPETDQNESQNMDLKINIGDDHNLDGHHHHHHHHHNHNDHHHH